MIRVGLIGCGYWGPNLARNFASLKQAQLTWIADLNPQNFEKIRQWGTSCRTTQDYRELIRSPQVDAVAIATPVSSHFPIAQEALKAGKHVLLEKPMTVTSLEAQTLIDLAAKQNCILMVDHTFVYSTPVQKTKEIIQSREIGDVLYFDSVRINLGLFQKDVNVIFDLAPHDLSIMDFLLEKEPLSASAVGAGHIHESIENIAYLTLKFEDNLIAHFHFNWMAPVKIRRTLIGGTKKMIVYDELEPSEKIKVYDKSVILNEESQFKAQIGYRIGDMYAPRIDPAEPLRGVCEEFLRSIETNRKPLTDGYAGLRVVQILEAAQQSLANDGHAVPLPTRKQPLATR